MPTRDSVYSPLTVWLTLVVATGYTLAAAPPVRRMLRAIACKSGPSTRTA